MALKKLDIKDSEGKVTNNHTCIFSECQSLNKHINVAWACFSSQTPLHLAAQKNQHFMVADLVSLGANVNAKDRYGKTCLHLSAENGYIRVLEVNLCGVGILAYRTYFYIFTHTVNMFLTGPERFNENWCIY